MYLACRHIKPNGVRCKSPALRGRAFCYFHSKLHSSSKISVVDDIELPVIEDSAAIQIALSRILGALLSSRIDSKRAGQLLYGLQIASQNVPRGWVPPPESVESLTQSSEGEELAPELRVCNGNDDCSACPYAETCPDYDSGEDDEDDDDDD
jgi:hypothetical protein